jgi:hypothetical protein
MYLFNFLSLFVFIVFNKNKKIKKISKISKISLCKGYDWRHNATNDLTSEELLKKIKSDLKKKELLDILQNNSIDNYTKLSIINKYDIISLNSNNFTSNLGSKDFYFDF